jgi:hypothetical protein
MTAAADTARPLCRAVAGHPGDPGRKAARMAAAAAWRWSLDSSAGLRANGREATVGDVSQVTGCGAPGRAVRKAISPGAAGVIGRMDQRCTSMRPWVVAVVDSPDGCA